MDISQKLVGRMVQDSCQTQHQAQAVQVHIGLTMGLSALIRRVRISSLSVGIIAVVLLLAYSVAISALVRLIPTPTMARAFHIAGGGRKDRPPPLNKDGHKAIVLWLNGFYKYVII